VGLGDPRNPQIVIGIVFEIGALLPFVFVGEALPGVVVQAYGTTAKTPSIDVTGLPALGVAVAPVARCIRELVKVAAACVGIDVCWPR
jgi:hypothetical protein